MRNPENTVSQNLLCFSHLRWDFVFQRPQHLMNRFAKNCRVFYMEEPVYVQATVPTLVSYVKTHNLTVIVPHIPVGTSPEETVELQQILLGSFLESAGEQAWTFWYYTPIALEFSRNYKSSLTVFDCMDELSAFRFAPESLKRLERELIEKADVVFTGGHSLYEAKKNLHSNIWPVPSSIEKEHFGKARISREQPADQAAIRGTKLGFFGVIDERFDLELIEGLSRKRPDWHIILIGPVVKIDPITLPKGANIHYLGQKNYSELPAYISGWDVALIPFAINESTEFISPTKTPEYLSAGIPVISTPIRDVILPYGIKKLVHIASDTDGFIDAVEAILKQGDKTEWLNKVDEFLKDISWDSTQEFMAAQLALALNSNLKVSIAS
ncbi:glycosyltransferase family 1 protein [Pedobacter sp.]|uniref:glycosyltransferase family 1 protein n=1 Tax=Pedobacter sp. TaxID=1411316 RepID=UPI003C4AE2E6